MVNAETIKFVIPGKGEICQLLSKNIYVVIPWFKIELVQITIYFEKNLQHWSSLQI